MILLIENITNKVLGTYSEYAYSPETQNAYSVRFDGDIPIGNGTLFYDDGTLFFVENLEYRLLQIKNNRTTLVENIEVEYNGVVYQGDETSQDRMNRAITNMLDDETISWVAKDNSIQVLSREDLKAIARLAGIEQTKLWIKEK